MLLTNQQASSLYTAAFELNKIGGKLSTRLQSGAHTHIRFEHHALGGIEVSERDNYHYQVVFINNKAQMEGYTDLEHFARAYGL